MRYRIDWVSVTGTVGKGIPYTDDFRQAQADADRKGKIWPGGLHLVVGENEVAIVPLVCFRCFRVETLNDFRLAPLPCECGYELEVTTWANHNNARNRRANGEIELPWLKPHQRGARVQKST